MNIEKKDQSKASPSSNDSKGATPKKPSGAGTEAERLGGIESAKRQAERDWEDSAKESGD